MTTKNLLERLLFIRPARAPEPLAPGLYHYMRAADGAYTRFHLRVDADGSGLLLANASAAARLTESGVWIAKAILDDKDDAAILHELAARFRGASQAQMQADLAQVHALLDELAAPGDNYPILNLPDAAFTTHAAQMIAPLQADVSPSAGSGQALAASDTLRVRPIIARLWEVGIPHVTFYVPPGYNGDPAELVHAVERAEDTGLIAGVRGRGSDLNSRDWLRDLAMAGLDHLTVLYAAADATIHDALSGAGDHAAATQALAAARELEVAPVAEVPLIAATLDTVEDTLDRLTDTGVTNVAFFAIATPETPSPEQADGALSADAMRQAAALVEDSTLAADVRYIWAPPLQRNPARTLSDQVRSGPRCSSDVSVRIEPDGAVIPPRGPYRSAGNLLADSWETIWGHAAFRKYRERVEAPTHCEVCPGLAICAADCPREPAGWSQNDPGGDQ